MYGGGGYSGMHGLAYFVSLNKYIVNLFKGLRVAPLHAKKPHIVPVDSPLQVYFESIVGCKNDEADE